MVGQASSLSIKMTGKMKLSQNPVQQGNRARYQCRDGARQPINACPIRGG